MDAVFQISSVAFAAALICVLLKSYNSVAAMLLSLAATITILLLTGEFMSPILTVLSQLKVLSGLSPQVTGPMMKIVAIGIITQIADSVCIDAGERALGKSVSLSGIIFSLYAAMPLISAVLAMLQNALEGTS